MSEQAIDAEVAGQAIGAKVVANEEEKLNDASVHYWVVSFDNEDPRTRQYKLCGTDKMKALALLWEQAAGDYNTNEYDELEIEKMHQRVVEEQRFFTWTWERRGYYHCVYILEGTATAVTDAVDIGTHFSAWD